MKASQAKLSRRHFLLAASVGAAASATAIVVKKESDSAASQDKSTESKGYQLTEHVRNYYRTAKI